MLLPCLFMKSLDKSITFKNNNHFIYNQKKGAYSMNDAVGRDTLEFIDSLLTPEKKSLKVTSEWL